MNCIKFPHDNEQFVKVKGYQKMQDHGYQDECSGTRYKNSQSCDHTKLHHQVQGPLELFPSLPYSFFFFHVCNWRGCITWRCVITCNVNCMYAKDVMRIACAVACNLLVSVVRLGQSWLSCSHFFLPLFLNFFAYIKECPTHCKNYLLLYVRKLCHICASITLIV